MVSDDRERPRLQQGLPQRAVQRVRRLRVLAPPVHQHEQRITPRRRDAHPLHRLLLTHAPPRGVLRIGHQGRVRRVGVLRVAEAIQAPREGQEAQPHPAHLHEHRRPGRVPRGPGARVPQPHRVQVAQRLHHPLRVLVARVVVARGHHLHARAHQRPRHRRRRVEDELLGDGLALVGDGRLQVHHAHVRRAQHVRQRPEDVTPALVIERGRRASARRHRPGARMRPRHRLHLAVRNHVPAKDKLHARGRGGHQRRHQPPHEREHTARARPTRRHRTPAPR
ncbi:hypothetical protein COSO111634_22430 [Corallococcus soli]